MLGGPPLDLGAVADSLAADLLPPSILGAHSDAAHAGEVVQATFNALPIEPVAAIGSDVLDHAATTVTEVAPLQLGFLGQPYVDAHHDDGGPHALSSPLHGFI